MSTATDSKRSRVYAAEREIRFMFDNADKYDARTVQVHGSAVTLPIERRFASVESVQSYVDRVLALNWLGAPYPNAVEPVRVRERRGQRFAHYEPMPPTIAVPLYAGNRAWALRELVVLHEIAHHLTAGDGHGRPFVECFTTLVAEIIGAEAGFLLRAAMHENGAV